jgi:amino acid transporter
MLGPAAVFAHVICGIVTVLVMACFVELASDVTRTGGPLAALADILGPEPGFLCWLLYGLYLFAACGFLSLALADAFGLLGAARLVGSAIAIVVISVINAFGVRYGVRFAVTTTVAKLVPLALIVIGGVFVMHRENLQIHAWPSSNSLGTAAMTLFFAFSGIEAAMLPAGEVKNPRTTVPRGIFVAVVSLMLIYGSVQFVSQGVLGSALRGEAPLADVAGAVFGPLGRYIVRFGTGISVLGSLSGALLTAPRWAFLGARMGSLPDVLGRVSPRYNTPLNAIVAICAAAALIALSGALQMLTAVTSAAILGVYLAVCLAVLRRRRDPAGFHLPGAKFIAAAGIVAIVWLLTHLSAREFLAVGGTLAAGILYRVAHRTTRRQAAV